MAGRLNHCRLPTPRHLEYTTPSRATALTGCKLRAAYDADPDHGRTVPSTPAARLGNIAHRVLERTGHGSLPAATSPNWRAGFDAAWDAAVTEEEANRAANPLEAHWPPPAKWPNYAIRKVATRRLAERIAQSHTHGADTRTDDAQHLHEHAQTAFSGKLRGRADVIRRGAAPAIEDYKTGSLLDGSTGELRESYRTQMLLYAVLEHAETGEWPETATLIPLDGDPLPIPVDPAEATAAANHALAALDAYNKAVAAGTGAAELAAPDPANCTFCAYSIICPAFWAAADQSWADSGLVAVAGARGAETLAEASPAFNVDIDGVAGTVPPGEYVLYQLDRERFSALLEAEPGSAVAAVRLRGDPERRRLTATAATRIACADSLPPAAAGNHPAAEPQPERTGAAAAARDERR